jgi:23S rRNA pseudouridine1911/1915/1917 synthase
MREIHLEAEVTAAMSGQRLDQVLSKCFAEYSRERCKLWILEGAVLVDGKVMRPRDKVVEGQKIVLKATLSEETRFKAESIALEVIHEDESIIVLNKPPGLVVHPGAGNPEGTLLNALLHHDPQLSTLPRAGIVHRLDKNTSGIMVVARTLEAHTSLVQQLQSRSIHRKYDTVVQGELISGGTVDAPIGRHPGQRTKMAVVHSGKPAITHYRVKERFSHFTRLTVQLDTGRTHQIRVHMLHIHHPVLGDPVYGGRLKLPANCSEILRDELQQFRRQALHAYRLTLAHPRSGETLSWEALLPEDYLKLLDVLRTEKNRLNGQ